MYIRVKKRIRKDNSILLYGYLVSSKRRYKKPRQKTLKYLGKVIDQSHILTNPHNPIDKEDYISKSKYNEIILDLLLNELKQIGFDKFKDKIYFKDDLKIDLNKFNLENNNKRPIIIKLNDGFICKYTINKLINFKFENKTQKENINLFANQLISTGINIDKELFILLFKKIYSYEID